MKAQESSVGIAIPAYRAAKTLEATLRSCIAQTWKRWEAFVTVDGSEEESREEREIVDRLGDARIHLEINGKPLRQFGNFNRALLRSHASGAKWTKFLCADDVLKPDALERMVALGESSARCALVYGYFDMIDEEGEVIKQVDLSGTRTELIDGREFLRRSIALFNVVGGPTSVMVRTELIEQAGVFDARLNYSGEASLWYRVVPLGDVGVVGERPIADYRMHENSVTGRGFASAARFENPLDIAKEVGLRYPVGSKDWRVVQATIAGVFAANVLTSFGLLRRGEVGASAMGVARSAAKLTPLAVLLLPREAVKVLARTAGLLRKREDSLFPPWRSETGHGAKR
jgi:glycosyltransferase involved in cell wall biosynthesis